MVTFLSLSINNFSVKNVHEIKDHEAGRGKGVLFLSCLSFLILSEALTLIIAFEQ